jgi:hypothetical protein
MRKTKSMLYCALVIYRMAQKHARENPFSLTQEECEAMELIGRRFHRKPINW